MTRLTTIFVPITNKTTSISSANDNRQGQKAKADHGFDTASATGDNPGSSRIIDIPTTKLKSWRSGVSGIARAYQNPAGSHWHGFTHFSASDYR